METEKLRKKQGNKYRNTQLRYSKIVHFTLWEECKQTQATEVERKGLEL